MIFIVDLNHDLNRWFKSFDLNQIHPAALPIICTSSTFTTQVSLPLCPYTIILLTHTPYIFPLSSKDIHFLWEWAPAPEFVSCPLHSYCYCSFHSHSCLNHIPIPPNNRSISLPPVSHLHPSRHFPSFPLEPPSLPHAILLISLLTLVHTKSYPFAVNFPLIQ